MTPRKRKDNTMDDNSFDMTARHLLQKASQEFPRNTTPIQKVVVPNPTGNTAKGSLSDNPDRQSTGVLDISSASLFKQVAKEKVGRRSSAFNLNRPVVVKRKDSIRPRRSLLSITSKFESFESDTTAEDRSIQNLLQPQALDEPTKKPFAEGRERRRRKLENFTFLTDNQENVHQLEEQDENSAANKSDDSDSSLASTTPVVPEEGFPLVDDADSSKQSANLSSVTKRRITPLKSSYLSSEENDVNEKRSKDEPQAHSSSSDSLATTVTRNLSEADTSSPRSLQALKTPVSKRSPSKGSSIASRNRPTKAHLSDSESPDRVLSLRSRSVTSPRKVQSPRSKNQTSSVSPQKVLSTLQKSSIVRAPDDGQIASLDSESSLRALSIRRSPVTSPRKVQSPRSKDQRTPRKSFSSSQRAAERSLSFARTPGAPQVPPSHSKSPSRVLSLCKSTLASPRKVQSPRSKDQLSSPKTISSSRTPDAPQVPSAHVIPFRSRTVASPRKAQSPKSKGQTSIRSSEEELTLSRRTDHQRSSFIRTPADAELSSSDPKPSARALSLRNSSSASPRKVQSPRSKPRTSRKTPQVLSVASSLRSQQIRRGESSSLTPGLSGTIDQANPSEDEANSSDQSRSSTKPALVRQRKAAAKIHSPGIYSSTALASRSQRRSTPRTAKTSELKTSRRSADSPAPTSGSRNLKSSRGSQKYGKQNASIDYSSGWRDITSAPSSSADGSESGSSAAVVSRSRSRTPHSSPKAEYNDTSIARESPWNSSAPDPLSSRNRSRASHSSSQKSTLRSTSRTQRNMSTDYDSDAVPSKTLKSSRYSKSPTKNSTADLSSENLANVEFISQRNGSSGSSSVVMFTKPGFSLGGVPIVDMDATYGGPRSRRKSPRERSQSGQLLSPTLSNATNSGMNKMQSSPHPDTDTTMRSAVAKASVQPSTIGKDGDSQNEEDAETSRVLLTNINASFRQQHQAVSVSTRKTDARRGQTQVEEHNRSARSVRGIELSPSHGDVNETFQSPDSSDNEDVVSLTRSPNKAMPELPADVYVHDQSAAELSGGSSTAGVQSAKGRDEKEKSRVPCVSADHTRQLLELYADMPISRKAAEFAENCSEIFWENTFKALGRFAVHAGRSNIEARDIELLLCRQGWADDRHSLNTLYEEYLPLELRSELIPMATAGNRVVP